jgi:hypothetical protein
VISAVNNGFDIALPTSPSPDEPIESEPPPHTESTQNNSENPNGLIAFLIIGILFAGIMAFVTIAPAYMMKNKKIPKKRM